MKKILSTLVAIFIYASPSNATPLQDLHHLDRTISASIDGWPVDDGLDANALALSDILHAGIADMIGQWPTLRKDERRSFAALMVSVALRETFGNRPFATERYTEWNRNACRIDLALDRFPVRLMNSTVQKQGHETLLSLIEFQNGLNCLSARQTRDFAWAFGQALLRTEHRLDLSVAERTAFFNLAMLTVDQAKFAGMSPLHRWLQAHGPALHDRMIAAKDTLYLYDYMTGHLIGISGVPLRALGLEQLLDPANIGMGSCSFLEMEGNSLNGGSHACARNMGCASTTPDPADLLNRNTGVGNVTDGTVILNRDLQLENQLELNGRDYSNLEFIAGPRTPFGTPVAALRPDVCDNGLGNSIGGLGTAGLGSGQGDARTGTGIAAFGNSNWVGCVAATTLANAHKDDWAVCQMNVAWNAANGAYDESYRTGGGIRAFGASGHGSCRDPLAGDGDGTEDASNSGSAGTSYDPYDGDTQDDEAAFTKGRENLVTDIRNDGPSRKAMEQFTASHLAKAKAWVQQQSDWSEEKKATALKHLEGLGDRRDEFIDKAADAISDAKLLHSEGVFGHTKGTEIKINAKEHNSDRQIEGTLLHEGMHVIGNLLESAGIFLSLGALEALQNVDDHSTIYSLEEGGDTAAEGWFSDRAAEGDGYQGQKATIRKIAECVNSPTTPSCVRAILDAAESEQEPSNFDQLPSGPALCGAQQAMMRDMMSCMGFTGGAGAGGDGTDPVASGGRSSNAAVVDPGQVLPTLEQWTNAQSNVFTQCMAKFGIGTAGVDENGFVIAGLNDPSNSTGCGAMICPPGGSAAKVGSGCACSGRNGELARPYTNDDLCFTSDACLPGKPEVFIVVTQPETDTPTLANPKLNGPGQPTILNLQNRSLQIIDGKLRFSPALETRGISRP